MRRGSSRRAAALVLVVSAAAFAVPAEAGPPTRNDPLFAQQWNLRQISAPEAWRHSTGAGAVVALVDTGADLSHPDLLGKLLPGYNCLEDASPQDVHGQGTFLAGVIGARTGNRLGVAGVAPAARILPVNVHSSECSRETWADSITWAVDRGADVIALTWMAGQDGYVWQLQGYYDEVKKAVDDAWKRGAVLVAPAGNQRLPICAEPWRDTRVLCVGSTNRHGVISTASSFDAAMRADYLVAPAGEYVGSGGYYDTPCDEGIVSTWLRGAPGENLTDCDVGDGYSVTATNRIAVAHVAGVAALLAAKKLDNRKIVQCLLGRTDDLGVSGRDPIYGYGRVNALKAVKTC